MDDLEDLGIPKYATSDEIAKLTGRTADWVRDQARHGVITACLTKGRQQFDRTAILKLLLLVRLQALFEPRSGVPLRLVENSDEAIVSLSTRPHEGTVIMLHQDGPMRFLVSVPPLAELVTA